MAQNWLGKFKFWQKYHNTTVQSLSRNFQWPEVKAVQFSVQNFQRTSSKNKICEWKFRNAKGGSFVWKRSDASDSSKQIRFRIPEKSADPMFLNRTAGLATARTRRGPRFEIPRDSAEYRLIRFHEFNAHWLGHPFPSPLQLNTSRDLGDAVLKGEWGEGGGQDGNWSQVRIYK